MLKAGDGSGISGFDVVEARPGRGDTPGRYEVQREVGPGTRVTFTGATEAEVMARAAAWLYEQARRKDGGALSVPPAAQPAKKVKTNKYEVEA